MGEIPTGPPLPGEPCRVPPHASWNDLEAWVWQEVGSGRNADINAHLGQTADPKKPEDWGSRRRLSPAFLETILLHDPWRSAIPRQGVRIVGALFDATIDLSWAELPCQIWLSRCRISAGAYLVRISAPGEILLDASAVTGALVLQGAVINGPLLMRDGAEFLEIDLRSAKLSGPLDLGGAAVQGTVNMDSTRIGTSVFMSNGAKFDDVVLRSTKIVASST